MTRSGEEKFWLRLLLVGAFAAAIVFIVRPRHPDFQYAHVAKNEKPEELQRALRWYADHALAALDPGDALTLPLRDYKNQLRDAGVVHPVMGPTHGTCLWIGSQFRSHVWSSDPMLPVGIRYSPFEYEILSVTESKKTESTLGDALQVKFQWRRNGRTPLARLLGATATSRSEGLPEQHEVVFVKGFYGYYLPIPVEPFYRSEECGTFFDATAPANPKPIVGTTPAAKTSTQRRGIP